RPAPGVAPREAWHTPRPRRELEPSRFCPRRTTPSYAGCSCANLTAGLGGPLYEVVEEGTAPAGAVASSYLRDGGDRCRVVSSRRRPYNWWMRAWFHCRSPS